MKFVMRTTNEYERLVQFFVKNGLEFDGDEEVDTDIIKCWKISQAVQADLTHIKDAHADGKDALVAGCVLARCVRDAISSTALRSTLCCAKRDSASCW